MDTADFSCRRFLDDLAVKKFTLECVLFLISREAALTSALGGGERRLHWEAAARGEEGIRAAPSEALWGLSDVLEKL